MVLFGVGVREKKKGKRLEQIGAFFDCGGLEL
jgi:hypothetical protein